MMKTMSRLIFLVFAVLNCVWPSVMLGQVPVVSSFSPPMGPIGTLVTISGTNFSAAASSNVVYFGAVRALVTDASPTSLMVVVPTGATYAPMTVTVNGLTAYANAPFVVTFPSPGIIEASSFLPKVDLATESNGYGLGIADLNNDGKSDLVVANYYNNLIVYQNQGSAGSLSTGSFAPYIDFKAGSGLIGAAVGDLDGDGNLDLVVVSEVNPIISVFRSAGAGGSLNSTSFAQHVDYPARTQPRLVAIRDLDGDGKPEIIVTSFSGTVSVYQNASVPGTIDASSFASRTDFSSGSGPFALAVADLDGDGKAELVVGNFWDNTVSVFRNTSTMGNIAPSTFAAPVTFTAGARPQGLAIGDLDGDGRPEIVVANYGENSVSILRNTSTAGTIDSNSFAAKVDLPTSTVQLSVAIGDLDGDGKLDIVSAGSGISIFQNRSTVGTIDTDSFGPRAEFPTGNDAFAVAIADLDGDGRPDIAVLNRDNGTLSLLRNIVGQESPLIAVPPQSQAVLAGSTVTFSVTADGTPPLHYQWRHDGTSIQDATNVTLTLTDVRQAQAGSYSVVVTNRFGSTTSADAVLTVNNPPALVAVVNVPGASGASVAVPVELVANGDENALGFSLQFDPALLQFTGAALAGGVPNNAALVVNDNNIATGQLGLAVALSTDVTFPEGTQQVVTVSFNVAPVLSPITAGLAMSDQPTTRQLSDTHAAPLPAIFQGGTITISRVDFEGDVAPRPGGDHALTIIDWVQVGRFVAGVDVVSDAEFQRADCAPRSTLGNGVLSITDWVQAGRYAAGLDPITPVGGPAQPVHAPAPALASQALSLGAGRTLALPQTNILPGSSATFTVRLQAQGDENALGFSLAFDAVRLHFLGASKASGMSNAVLNLNTNQAAAGQLGVALALPAGATLSAGAKEVLLLTLGAASNATGMGAMSFSDQPIVREISDALANPLPAAYYDGSILVGLPRPSLGLTRSGHSAVLFWPSTATGYVLQATSGPLGTPWTNVDVTPLEFGGQKLVPLPTTGSEKYFRLKQP